MADTSERVRHAVIGCGGQGQQHIRVFADMADCEVAAVCDLDPERRAKGLSMASDGARAEADFRRVLDDPTIDSVSVVTPDHWHTPIAVFALQAGKHVYVEKPCSHTVDEARMLTAAAHASGKCVQHGTQSRGSTGIKDGIAFLQSGELGKIRMAKAINHQLRGPIGRVPESSQPDGVDYDLWLGPAPVRPFTLNRWHYNWHWYWEYGGGDMVNDGIHQVDVARWGLGQGLPKAVSASGGQLFYDDDHETPDTQVVTFEYDDCYLLYEMRLWTPYPLEGHDNGVVFYGDNGILSIGRKGCEARFKDGERREVGGTQDIAEHMRNFIACVMAEDPSGLDAPIASCADSATLCNLGNIASRVGKRLTIDPESGRSDDSAANTLMGYEYREAYGLRQLQLLAG
ncbi:MAG: gfo/Idh/MocA family oxidoreductase [Candidatus Hydrogenedens sp.]|nr:gfo/Idh/MocA family oxidoreductase [Candidatus Hydrogenedens sp.]